MKIAVTFENGEIFQHFGHTEHFKVYEVEGTTVVSSEVIDTAGQGHEALADFLASRGVDTLICGGLGDGAQDALTEQCIGICAGQSGDADETVEKFLKGELINSGANCDHHMEEAGGCGGCGGGCGGCGGGCHSYQPSFEGPNIGKTVRAHYEGTLNDGTKFDSSYDRGQPLEFVCGTGMMIEGFDAAVAKMAVGDILNVHLMPEEAYGPYDPEAVFTVEIAKMPGAEGLETGQQVYLQNAYGQPFPVKVQAKDDTTITFDANDELAGKELNFKIELMEIL